MTHYTSLEKIQMVKKHKKFETVKFVDDFDEDWQAIHTSMGVHKLITIRQGRKIMNVVNCFARRIVSVVALAVLVLTGWPQLGHAQPTGIEPQAEKLLKRMSDYLAGRQQFTLRAESIARSRADIRAEAAV